MYFHIIPYVIGRSLKENDGHTEHQGFMIDMKREELLRIQDEIQQFVLAKRLFQVTQRLQKWCQVVRTHVIMVDSIRSRMISSFLNEMEMDGDTNITLVKEGEESLLSNIPLINEKSFQVGILYADALSDSWIFSRQLLNQLVFQQSFQLVLVISTTGIHEFEYNGYESHIVYHQCWGLSNRQTVSCTCDFPVQMSILLRNSKTIQNLPIEFVVRPMIDLRKLCGLKVVMELFFSKSSQYLTGRSLPLQFVLLALRWSSFHPRIVSEYFLVLRKKLRFLPESKDVHAIEKIIQEHWKLWSLTSVFQDWWRQDSAQLDEIEQWLNEGLTGGSRTLSTSSNLLHWVDEILMKQKAASTSSSNAYVSLSECVLWNIQKNFYKQQGIEAWSKNLIPFGVSSSSFIAFNYAQIVVDFLLDAYQCGAINSTVASMEPNCFILEGGSGSCKFGMAFLRHFFHLTEQFGFDDKGIKPQIILCDLSEQVLLSRIQMEVFQPFLKKGQLDFASLDTEDILSKRSKKYGVLMLRNSRKILRFSTLNGPLFVVGNYFYDSLRTDAFVVAQRNKQITQYFEAVLDKTTEHIADMEFDLRELDAKGGEVYNSKEDVVVRQTLLKVFEEVTTQSKEREQHQSLILFPVETLRFIGALYSWLSEGENGRPTTNIPLGFLIGDASYSFRDPLTSTLVDEGLQVPQLSPTASCFCVPLDFEVVQLFFNQLSVNFTTNIVAPLASDTFTVMLGTIGISKVEERVTTPCRVVQSFRTNFEEFCPSDLDLVWGMMGIEKGAKYLTAECILSLLAGSEWDFDLFVIVQWYLILRVKERKEEASSDKKRTAFLVLSVLEAGRRCTKNMYTMDNTWNEIVELQLSRWFYELGAYEDAILLTGRPYESYMTPERVLYLHALARIQLRDSRAGLFLLRKCASLQPSKIKYRRLIAQIIKKTLESSPPKNKGQIC